MMQFQKTKQEQMASNIRSISVWLLRSSLDKVAKRSEPLESSSLTLLWADLQVYIWQPMGPYGSGSTC